MLACDTDIIGTRSMHTPSNILYTCYHIEKYMFWYHLLKKKFIYPCILLWANQRLMESKGLMEHDLKSNKIHVLVIITNAKIVKICLILLIIFLLITNRLLNFLSCLCSPSVHLTMQLKYSFLFFQNVNLASINGC